MLKHFEKLQSPLKSVLRYPTLQHQRARFLERGWKHVGCRSLWEIWADNDFLTTQERRDLDLVESFDEWEEFALFTSHYFLLLATNTVVEPREIFDPAPNTTSPGPEVTSSPNSTAVYTPTFQAYPQSLGQRRYAAGFLSYKEDAVYVHGGHGARGRLDNYDLYLTDKLDEGSHVSARISYPIKLELMCHTITRLSSGKSLLAGGRSSPDKIHSECFIQKVNKWNKVQDLPFPLYRHAAVTVDIPCSEGICEGVLIYGGRMPSNEVSDRFLLWNYETGWTLLEAGGDVPPARFGAALGTTGLGTPSGILTGGLGEGGTILQDFWEWRIEFCDNPVIICRNRTGDLSMSTVQRGALSRFGAQLVKQADQLVLVGGVGILLLTEQDEILTIKNLSIRRLPMSTSPLSPRPMLIGHTVVCTKQDSILITGGGAVCFSFGTWWNEGNYTLSSSAQSSWRLTHDSPISMMPTREKALPIPLQDKTSKGSDRIPEGVAIKRVQIESAEDFDLILTTSKPVILENLDIGRCTSTWTPQYLKDKIGSRSVAVHCASTPNMNFVSKNFKYETKAFDSFIEDIEHGKQMYLRALSSAHPAEQPTHLSEDFPQIADDFSLPPSLSFVKANAHSSPLRLSGPVTMWLHYDVRTPDLR